MSTRRPPRFLPRRDLEQLLFRRHRRDGDLRARRQLIERYLPLARSLARRYEGQTVAESFGVNDERFELIDARTSIGPALRTLPERERLILHLRFVEDLTQSEIARRVGVSQMQVSRLIRRALERVRLVAGPTA